MDDRPFSLRPRSTQRQGPQSIAEFIQRVNAEPGGFRSLNSAEVRRRIEAGQNGIAADQDVDMTADTSDDDDDDADTIDVVAAREEIVKAIHQTRQTSMFALDFVSLLLSKENPAQAVTTFSNGLRDMVGIGTLGATMLDAPTILTQSMVPGNKMVAIGKRLMDLNKAADTALAASKRLQQEIGTETKYWSEVLRVGDNGWQTFRLPHESQTLGVKFGFSDNAPEFKHSGIAPLRRAEDGSVRLEHGAMSGGSKRLQVRFLENGVVVGKSSLPRPLPPDAPLEDRVKEARDTVFAQELWYEINREARVELDGIVRIAGSVVAYDFDTTRTISLQLVTPAEEEAITTESPSVQDAAANELCILASLLLSNAHRTNALKRSDPTATKGSIPPYLILRPLVSHYNYDQYVQQAAQSLATFISVLRSAGIASCVTMKEPALKPGAGSAASATASLASTLLEPPKAQFDLTITPAARMRILLKSARLSGATYSVSFLPALPQEQQQPGAPTVNPVPVLCPPGSDDFPDLRKLLAYVYSTVPCALAWAYSHLALSLQGQQQQQQQLAADGDSDDELQGTGPEWGANASLNGIVDVDTGGQYGVRFEFGPNVETGQLEVRMTGDFADKVKKVRQEWRWPGSEQALDAAVEHVLRNGPKE